MDLATLFLAKAQESLAGADSELLSRRFNNAANRTYYACVHAAISALLDAGAATPGRSGEWGHDFVQARFAGELIARRKLYSSDLRDILGMTMRLRHKADYQDDGVSEVQASRAVRRAHALVEAIRQVAGGRL